jgi:hypothetical protein
MVIKLLATCILMVVTAFVALTEHPDPHTQSIDRRVALAEIGLGASDLAAVGLQASAVSELLDQLDQQHQTFAAMATAKNALLTATEQVTSLGQQLAKNPLNQEIRAQYNGAIQASEAAKSQVSSLRNDLFGAVTDGLASSTIQRLSALRQSSARKVPVEFRVVSRTDSHWQAIELALIAEARAQRMGDTLAGESASLLANVRMELDVAEAALSLQSNLSAVQQLLNPIE